MARPLFASVLLCLAAAGAASAAQPGFGLPAKTQEETPVLLVSTDWLGNHLGDANLVLLHVGDRAEYDAAHIPGARFVSLLDLSEPMEGPDALHLQMLPPDRLRPRLEALGISDGSRIVVYFGSEWISATTRMLFTLDYAGLGARAAMLDGGQPAWVKQGRAVTAEAPVVPPGKLSPLSPRPSIVDAKFVFEHRATPGYAILDARDAVFFEGTDRGGPEEKPHRAGHVAGARSLPYSSLFTDDLHLRPRDELRAAFAKAGVKPGDVVVAYCHIGQQATAVIHAARLLGFEAKLFDGSFEQWSGLPAAEAPVEMPAPPAQPQEKPAS